MDSPRCIIRPIREPEIPLLEEFLEYARRHSDQRFLVYDVFSDALFNPAEMMRLFDEAATIPNICLPEAFWHIHYKRCSV